MVPSNSPTDIKIYAIPGIGVEVHAVFHQANSLPGTYAQFQVSTDPNFGTTDYDSGQVSIDSIADGTEGVMVFKFVPSTPDTYYYRLCFWDDDNYTKTMWQVWNGTTIGSESKVTYLRPISDYSIQIETATPSADHYANVDEETQDGDSSYNGMAGSTVAKDQTDLFNLEDLVDDYFKDITRVVLAAYWRAVDTSGFLYFRIITHGTTYTPGGESTITNTYFLSTYSLDTNPYTSAAWTLDEVNDLIGGVELKYPADYSGQEERVTQYYVEVDYEDYTFTFTPPNNNVLDVGFPIIISQQVING